MRPNIHGGLVAIDGHGILILGPARAGKSSLAFCLLRLARREGRAAHLVADDQVLLEARDGVLFGHVPPSIAGMMELSGVGILPMPHVDRAPVALVATLSDDPPRLPRDTTIRLCDIALPHTHLPARQACLGAEILLALAEPT